MRKDVPLVVPEVNENDINYHNGIISIPNCTTTPLVMAIHNLRKLANFVFAKRYPSPVTDAMTVYFLLVKIEDIK